MKNIGLAYDPRVYKPISYDVTEALKSERRYEVQDVTEEPSQTISPVQMVPQTQSYVQTVPQTQSYVQTVPQTQSYVQYVPVVTKPDYKKIILVGGGIILFAILLKKVIR